MESFEQVVLALEVAALFKMLNPYLTGVEEGRAGAFTNGQINLQKNKNNNNNKTTTKTKNKNILDLVSKEEARGQMTKVMYTTDGTVPAKTVAIL